MRTFVLACCLLLCTAGAALAQQPAPSNVNVPLPDFKPPQMPIVPPWDAFVFTEPVKGSDIPVDITLLETVDGLYMPIGLRHPQGKGPFPIVMFFSGNGGSGVRAVRESVNNAAAYTMDRYLKAGYAVGYLNYRAESWFEYTRVKPLTVSHHQANQLLNRPPLEYNDLMTIVQYVKTLPYVDPGRVGLCGNSHGGGMILKAGAEGMQVAAAISSEPDTSEFLQIDEKGFAGDENQLPTMESAAPFLKHKDIAMERIRRINFPVLFVLRTHDSLEGLFETAFTWMKEAGKNVESVKYDHPVHGFIIRVPRDEKGNAKPDDMQLKIIQQSIDFFNKNMPAGGTASKATQK